MPASPEIRAEALFLSPLQPSAQPSLAQITAAIDERLNELGEQGCLAGTAAEYGEHPDVANVRMRWALEMVTAWTT